MSFWFAQNITVSRIVDETYVDGPCPDDRLVGDIFYTMSGSSISSVGFAPTCSTFLFQLEPR